MPTKINSITASLLGFILFSLAATGLSAQESKSHTVVVHPSVGQHSVSVNAIRAIFGMRLRTWPDGTPTKVFVLRDDHPTHIAFSKETLNVFPHQLRMAWDRLVFSGTGQAPTEVDGEEEMRSKVASTPGAIGYLKKDMVNDDVHILEIK